MSDHADHERQLEEARRKGDPDAIAETLLVYANDLIQAARFGEARRAIDEAGRIHQERARPHDEARCCHLAATLYRLEGLFDEAERRAHRATRLAAAGTPTMVAGWSELGEIALGRGDGTAAAVAFERALEEGRQAGLLDMGQAALLRKRAHALAVLERFTEAAALLRLARTHYQQAGEREAALETRIEEATALTQAGDEAGARRERDEIEREATQAGDRHALADLALLRAAEELARGDLDGARSNSLAARDHALAAVAPLSYVAAAISVAEIADKQGDRLASYGALAAGWVTLADLLGQEVARATFSPRLTGLQQSWGDEEFQAVKVAYEEQRQAAAAPPPDDDPAAGTPTSSS